MFIRLFFASCRPEAAVHPYRVNRKPVVFIIQLKKRRSPVRPAADFYVRYVMLISTIDIFARLVWRKARPNARLKTWKTIGYVMTQ
jgi:hypothetical protein